jgi:hypothetical protein
VRFAEVAPPRRSKLTLSPLRRNCEGTRQRSDSVGLDRLCAKEGEQRVEEAALQARTFRGTPKRRLTANPVHSVEHHRSIRRARSPVSLIGRRSDRHSSEDQSIRLNSRHQPRAAPGSRSPTKALAILYYPTLVLRDTARDRHAGDPEWPYVNVHYANSAAAEAAVPGRVLSRIRLLWMKGSPERPAQGPGIPRPQSRLV